MVYNRYTLAAGVSLVGGNSAILAQYLVTPLSSGNLTSTELLDKVASHHTEMAAVLPSSDESAAVSNIFAKVLVADRAAAVAKARSSGLGTAGWADDGRAVCE